MLNEQNQAQQKPRGQVLYEYTKFPVQLKVLANVGRDKVIADKLILCDSQYNTILLDKVVDKEEALDLCDLINWMEGYIIHLSTEHNKLKIELEAKKEVLPVQPTAPQVSEQPTMVAVQSEATATETVTTRHETTEYNYNHLHPAITFLIMDHDKSVDALTEQAYPKHRVFAHCNFPEGVHFVTQYDNGSGDKVHPDNRAQKHCKICYPSSKFPMIDNRRAPQS